MSLDEVIMYWQQYVAQLAELLKKIGGQQAVSSSARAAAAERLSQLAGEACIFLVRVAWVNPVTARVSSGSADMLAWPCLGKNGNIQPFMLRHGLLTAPRLLSVPAR